MPLRKRRLHVDDVDEELDPALRVLRFLAEERPRLDGDLVFPQLVLPLLREEAVLKIDRGAPEEDAAREEVEVPHLDLELGVQRRRRGVEK